MQVELTPKSPFLPVDAKKKKKKETFNTSSLYFPVGRTFGGFWGSYTNLRRKIPHFIQDLSSQGSVALFIQWSEITAPILTWICSY